MPLSKTLGKYLLLDEKLTVYAKKGIKSSIEIAIFGLGRIAKYLASIFGNEKVLENIDKNQSFTRVIYLAFTGHESIQIKKAELIEAMIVASVDHGVTPPSTQAARIAASVRAPFEVAIAQGIGAITDVHGGAGTKATLFYKRCIELSKEKKLDLFEATHQVISEYIRDGKRVQGMGHRIHTKDPRRDILWTKAEEACIAAESVKISKEITDIFKQVRGIELPINVDGVIGAIIADMDLDPKIAKAVFIFGRVAGMSAHYFEEIISSWY